MAVAVVNAPVSGDPMPITGLAPSKIVPGLCEYQYPAGTRSEECQAFCDQALGYYYSYVWMEAARSFETALQHDPDCAFAWLGLHRALDKWGKRVTDPQAKTAFLAGTGAVWQGQLPESLTKPFKTQALEKAKELMPLANHQVQFLVQARLQELGMWPNVPADQRKKKAQETLDEMLTLYDDDQEGWYARAQVAEGRYGRAPFYKALLRINPIHPGANHELVHFYENIRRPALGWPYAEGYMKSSPGLPHALHMQAHLAMRIGKWKNTTDWSKQAFEIQREYHRQFNVKPSEDHQYFHHAETLTRSLVHDGRFAEAKGVRKLVEADRRFFRPEWFRMAVGQQDWEEAKKIVDAYAKTDKTTAAYFRAVLALEQGDTKGAKSAVDVLRQASQTKKNDRRLEQRLWEVQGRLMCQTGDGEGGSKLLKRVVDKTMNDYSHHAWGGGAYFMEVWGIAALEAGMAADAEEAFQEALAHDAGSVRGALGMWALCERLGRKDEAARFMKVAERCWARADAEDFERLKTLFQTKAQKLPTASVAQVGG